MPADYILRAAVPRGSAYAVALRGMSDELHARGCTFVRANPWFDVGSPTTVVVTVEGWLVRPDDQGDVPPRDAGEAWPP